MFTAPQDVTWDSAAALWQRKRARWGVCACVLSSLPLRGVAGRTGWC